MPPGMRAGAPGCVPGSLGRSHSGALLPAGRTPVIGSLGKLSSAKRIPQLLHAYSRLLRRFPNALLVLAGEGVEDSALKIRLDALGLEDGREVLLRGYVPAKEFSALAAESDICVSLRTPTLGEAPASAIAALAAETPLVVSDVGWFSEFPIRSQPRSLPMSGRSGTWPRSSSCWLQTRSCGGR